MSMFKGKNLQMIIFGESHGAAVGVTITGLPSGLPLDQGQIAAAMHRRAPGGDDFSTARKEDDNVQILSGVYAGKTSGTPLCAIIANTDTKSDDYGSADILRPGHADYTGKVRYQDCNDHRGGGHFSGRLTAPLVFAGALAQTWLQQQGIVVGAHIASIADISDRMFDPCHITAAILQELQQKPFAVLDEQKGRAMQNAILQAKADGDSVGGIIECAACNLPAGWGDPMFAGMESVISSLLFAVPAVKGVEFGSGFAISSLKGSEANDPFALENDKVITTSNHNGGINGGITNGMPLVMRAAIKPTPSISKEQQSIDLKKRCPLALKIKGRHDPCIVPRAVVVVESALQIALMDLGLNRR
jgi:chorismate synthase